MAAAGVVGCAHYGRDWGGSHALFNDERLSHLDTSHLAVLLEEVDGRLGLRASRMLLQKEGLAPEG